MCNLCEGGCVRSFDHLQIRSSAAVSACSRAVGSQHACMSTTRHVTGMHRPISCSQLPAMQHLFCKAERMPPAIAHLSLDLERMFCTGCPECLGVLHMDCYLKENESSLTVATFTKTLEWYAAASLGVQVDKMSKLHLKWQVDIPSSRLAHASAYQISALISTDATSVPFGANWTKSLEPNNAKSHHIQVHHRFLLSWA